MFSQEIETWNMDHIEESDKDSMSDDIKIVGIQPSNISYQEATRNGANISD